MPLLSFVGAGSRAAVVVVPSTRMRGENQIIMPAQSRSMYMSNSNRSIIMPPRRKKVKL